MRTSDAISEVWREAARRRDEISAELAKVRERLDALEAEETRLRAAVATYEDRAKRGDAGIEEFNAAAAARRRLAELEPELAEARGQADFLRTMQHEPALDASSARLSWYGARKEELEAEIGKRIVASKEIAALLVELHALPAALGCGQPPRPGHDADPVEREVRVPLRSLCGQIAKRAEALRRELEKAGLR